MKKLLIFLTMILVVLSGCSSLKRDKTKNEVLDIRATISTSQGDLNFYLYPEVAPIAVANFINLSKRGYYDDMKFHRYVENFMVQGGDPTGTGTGGPGYFFQDEFSEWLDFYQPGMLAMANAGPNTNGSQFFITKAPAEWLNKRHTVFGELIADEDMQVLLKLEKNDVIKGITFTGPVDKLLNRYKTKISEWDTVLDKNFPNLKKYEIK